MQTDIAVEHNIAIVGAGKLGRSLFELMRANEFEVTLINREYDNQALQQASIIVVCVPDRAIAECLNEILPYIKSNTVITHCSGSESSEILAEARQKDCYIASTHPFNTFPTLQAARQTLANNEHGTWLFAEGDQHALDVLMPMFSSIGFRIRQLESQNKVLYHAACVTVCNYLVSLMDSGLNMAEHAGLQRDDFWQASLPIIEQTLKNISQRGTANSLSGPIARGDLQTIEKHLAELDSSNRDDLILYTSLGQKAASIAHAAGQIDEQTQERVLDLLKKNQ